MRSPIDLDLRIEQLVLHGFADVDREQLADAVVRGLAALFERQGVPPGLARPDSLSSLDGPRFQVRPGESAETVGTRLAQAIYDRLASAAGGTQDRES
jgi:hypothetical protein